MSNYSADYQLILLKNLSDKRQISWLKNLLESLMLDREISDIKEYIDNIDKSLKQGDNPIENPDLLDKRKKS